jgi:hypothetical protein
LRIVVLNASTITTIFAINIAPHRVLLQRAHRRVVCACGVHSLALHALVFEQQRRQARHVLACARQFARALVGVRLCHAASLPLKLDVSGAASQ